MDYKVSVIIPTYNAEKFIERAINCLKKQTIGFENIEIIIVDDNSTDNTKKILEEFSSKYENIKTLFFDNNSRSPGRGRNLGMGNASSEYIMFLDVDDIFTENMCKVMYETIDKTKANVVMSNFKFSNDEEINNYKESEINTAYILCNPKKSKFIFFQNHTWNKIYDLNFIKKICVKFPNSVLLEDMSFTMNIFLNTEEIVYIKDFYGYLYNVRDTGDLSTCNNINIEKYVNSFYVNYEIADAIQSIDNPKLLNCFLKEHLITLIGWFTHLECDKNQKIIILRNLHEYVERYDFNEKLDEIWAEMIFSNIRKEKYKNAIFFSDIIHLLFNSYSLRKIYRIIYNRNK